MGTAAVLAGLALLGAALVADQVQRLKPALQPVRVKSNEGRRQKPRG